MLKHVYPQSKVQDRLQLKAKWGIRDRVTRQRSPFPPGTMLDSGERAPYPCVVSEGLNLSVLSYLWVYPLLLQSCCYSMQLKIWLLEMLVKQSCLVLNETCQVKLNWWSNLWVFFCFFFSSWLFEMSAVCFRGQVYSDSQIVLLQTFAHNILFLCDACRPSALLLAWEQQVAQKLFIAREG